MSLVIQVHSQNLEAEMLYPDTLRSSQDSFFVHSNNFKKVWSRLITRDDTLNLGTSGFPGVHMTIWTDIDTIHIPHVNFPYRQKINIPIVSPTDTALCILRFQAASAHITDEYALATKGKYEISIPEVYELANVILYLSQCSAETGNRPQSDYADKVLQYFAPYRNHKLIQVLNNNCTGELWRTYYGFRENSICFNYERDDLQYNTTYKQAYWDNSRIMGGNFRNMLYLIQDFSNKSNFRKFYNDHLNYYQQLIDRQKQLLPIQEMWSWLESEFPQRMDSYKIIFSPLIGGSHSTQKFHKGFFRNPEFQECIMFINSPESIDAKNDYEEQLKEGLMSGIVFTEIDHNYVNPTSDSHANAISNLISDKDLWATKKAQKNYSSERSIFNEYMTHALFCLYAKEHYDIKISEQIIESRLKLMERRGFMRFKGFNEILLSKMQGSKETVSEAYEEIISDMKVAMW